MPSIVAPTEQRVTLAGLSWDTYERLLAEHQGAANPRFAYDRGVLEIMVVSYEHEELNRLIAALFEAAAAEVGIDFANAGSTTFKRQDLARGFEPDTAFYVRHAARMRGKRQVDPVSDPPPDLVIEVDITHSSLDKLAIYAAIAVPEVWRLTEEDLIIYVLGEDGYARRGQSQVLPGARAEDLSHFVREGRTLERPAWVRAVRDWARGLAR